MAVGPDALTAGPGVQDGGHTTPVWAPTTLPVPSGPGRSGDRPSPQFTWQGCLPFCTDCCHGLSSCHRVWSLLGGSVSLSSLQPFCHFPMSLTPHCDHWRAEQHTLSLLNLLQMELENWAELTVLAVSRCHSRLLAHVVMP